MKGIGAKKQAQLRIEEDLTAELFTRQAGLCADCKGALGWGSAKHEIKHRSQGGSPVDEGNCVLLCLRCHNARHGIRIKEWRHENVP